MLLWLSLFVAFVIQEPVSANTVLLFAYQQHYNPWIIHALFVLGTVFDIVVGYYLGLWLLNSTKHTTITRYIHQGSELLLGHVGPWGTRIIIFFFGSIPFPVSALAIPLIELPFWQTALLMFLSEVIFWYGASWLVVLGIGGSIPNPTWALVAVAIVTLLLMMGWRMLHKRLR